MELFEEVSWAKIQTRLADFVHVLVYFGNLRENAPCRYCSADMLFARDKDRRQSYRQWVAVPVLMRHRGSRIEGLSINISEGGMYLFAAANLLPGTQIEIEFCPPESKELVRTCGAVRRRALYLYAIEFLNEDAASAHDRTSAAEPSRRRSPWKYVARR